MKNGVKTIYFDMDGTLANLYGVNDWLKALRSFDPRPYAEAPALFDTLEMSDLMQALSEAGYRIGVISWLSKVSTPDYDKAVRNAKRTWLVENFPYVSEIHLVKYGTPKYSVVREMGYLVDDERQNLTTWAAHGGLVIPASEMMTRLRQLVREG